MSTFVVAESKQNRYPCVGEDVIRNIAVALLVLLACVGNGVSQPVWTTPTTAEVDAIYPDIEALYIDLHQHPELAFQETQTAAKLAGRREDRFAVCQ